MKKSLLIKLHVYAGLFTCFYLIAFGFSTLLLNHNINLEKTTVKKEWEASMVVDTTLESQLLAETLRDNLGLMGWVPPWEFKRDTISFQFVITHPGRKYHVQALLGVNKLKIAESPKGFLYVLQGLHFFNGKLPNAPLFLRSWKFYQWLTLFVMLVSLVLGLWIWLRYNKKRWEISLFGVILIISLIVMMSI